MEIIKTNLPENPTMDDLYSLLEDEDREPLKNLAGTTIDVETYAIYTDENARGEEVKLLAIKAVTGAVAVTNSPTAIRAFERLAKICEMAGGEISSIEVVKEKSKGSREFINIKLPY